MRILADTLKYIDYFKMLYILGKLFSSHQGPIPPVKILHSARRSHLKRCQEALGKVFIAKAYKQKCGLSSKPVYVSGGKGCRVLASAWIRAVQS